MEVEINYVALFGATAANMVVGSIYYAKPAFGKRWQRLAKLDDKQLRAAGPKSMIAAVVLSFLMAYVLAHVTFISQKFYGVSFLESGINTAFWLWLGIAMTTIVVNALFEQRPTQLTLLSVGYWFAGIMVMGLIIGSLGV